MTDFLSKTDRQMQHQMQKEEHARQVEEHHKFSRPVVNDLRAIGYDINDIQDLRCSGRKYDSAIDVLIKWLPKVRHTNVKWEIVSVLAAPWAKRVLPALLTEFETVDPPEPMDIRWTIGNAIGRLADDSVFDQIVALANNPKYGHDRGEIVLSLHKMKRPGVDQILMDLLRDPDVNGHALEALLKRRVKIPTDVVEAFLKDDRPWVRKIASKMLMPGAKPIPSKKEPLPDAQPAREAKRRAEREWCQNTEWTPEIREAFFKRLSRARPVHASNYLQIQAQALLNTGDCVKVQAALELIDMCLERYPDDLYLVNIHSQRADCFVALGRLEDAAAALRASLEAQRKRPNVIIHAGLNLAWFIVEHELRHLYGEARTAAEVEEESGAIPGLRYRRSAVRAVLAEHSGDMDSAKQYAQAALSEAMASKSGFANHPTFGLVSASDLRSRTHRHLLTLAGRLSAPLDS